MAEALLIGSTGVLVETSHLHRDAYNKAFSEAGLDWHWSEDAYRAMLEAAGDRARIQRYAEEYEDIVDVDDLERRKTANFVSMMEECDIELRDGIADTLAAAREENLPVALVRVDNDDEWEAVLGCLEGLSRDDFAHTGDAATVKDGKPSVDHYAAALEAVGLDAARAVAVEDSPDGVGAAADVGVAVHVFPGAMHIDREFPRAASRLERLSADVFRDDE